MNGQVHVLALAALVYLAAPAAAQDIDRVRALYVAAAYEDALAAIPSEASFTVGAEIEQYRALCLLALGREDDARVTIERLVRAHPTFVPPAAEVSPSMRALFTRVRRELMPDMVKQVYLDAKVAYESKDRDLARAGFQRTLDLIASLPEEDRAALADLRLLASEFRELSAPRPAASVEPAVSAAKPAIEAWAAVPFVPAVVVSQELPAWSPPDAMSRSTEYTGLLRVHIGADGGVTSVAVVEASHPAYDAAVLQAAKSWAYRPATRGGKPVASEHDIEIRLRPR
jgi:TonB family protein